MGDQSELASREQQVRLFESGGMLHVETLPVAGTSIDSLYLDRLNFYLASIIEDPEVPSNQEQWIERLLGLGLMAEDGLVCFGIRPRRYLPQAGLRVMAFYAADKEYHARLDTVLDGPLVGRWRMANKRRELVDQGVIEQFSAALLPFISCEDDDIDEQMHRGKEILYPIQAVRETVVNALALTLSGCSFMKFDIY
ncbi:MAG: hypothetical protein V8K32_13140 [Candidatus Electrothrix gigas]